jgi:hypothetical protein
MEAKISTYLDFSRKIEWFPPGEKTHKGPGSGEAYKQTCLQVIKKYYLLIISRL